MLSKEDIHNSNPLFSYNPPIITIKRIKKKKNEVEEIIVGKRSVVKHVENYITTLRPSGV